MSREDHIADALETGDVSELSATGAPAVDRLRGVLASEEVWAEPPSDLRERISSAVESPPVPVSRWIWAAAGVVVLLGLAFALSQFGGDDGPSVAAVVLMQGTELAPEATGSAGLIPSGNGWAIDFDVTGLPPAVPGTFYQAWVDNGSQQIAVGSFHMRAQRPTPIALWAGVDLREYRTIRVTLQEEDGGPQPSQMLVMTGTAEPFE